MKEVTLSYPPIVKPTAVELTKKWSDWDAGDIITMDSEKAKRVIAKGYGIEHKPKKRPPTRGAAAETADLEPGGEQAVATPQKQGKPAADGKAGD